MERHGDRACVQVQRGSGGVVRAGRAIDRIAQHRATERAEVHAQLVGAPGQGAQLQPREIAGAAEDAVIGDPSGGAPWTTAQ